MPDDTAASLARREAAAKLVKETLTEREESQRGKAEMHLLMREKKRLWRRGKRADRELATFLGVGTLVGVGGTLLIITATMGGAPALLALGIGTVGGAIGGSLVGGGTKAFLNYMRSVRERKRQPQESGV